MNSSAQYPVKVYHNYRQKQKSSSNKKKNQKPKLFG